MRVGINGFGRMGRLALRAGWTSPELEFVAINEPAGDNEALALLLEFDTLHGRFEQACAARDEGIGVGPTTTLARHRVDTPADIPWKDHGVDLVLECSGRFRHAAELEGHRDRGAAQVLVSAPVRDIDANLVFGVNHQRFDLAALPLLSATSCTTNCLAPLVKVLHAGLGIERGLVTTIHAPTNTQEVLDLPQRDVRRSRAASQHLIPTGTNSAYAVTLILPELAGKLDSIAVRNPCLNASLVDCVFQLRRDTDPDEVGQVLRDAAATAPLEGILGFEDRDRRRPVDAGDRREPPQGARLVRQRVGLRLQNHRSRRGDRASPALAVRDLRSYGVVSATYGAFTVTDGALRTLVLLYLHSLGYTPLELATLFLLYEFFGVVTNLFGGWLGGRFGLNTTLYSGLTLQILACGVLAARATELSVPLVMLCQGLSGIAKDLTKMSSKSFVKLVVPEDDAAGLLRWVTLITGSKNTLKGVGFLLGGVALQAVGFAAACGAMAALVAAALAASVLGLPRAAGKTSAKRPLRSVFSDDARINWLAAARFFLFGSRDLWFAVALPVFLASSLGWGFPEVSAFLAVWIIGYGAVQALAPVLLRRPRAEPLAAGALFGWTTALLIPLVSLALSLHQGLPPGIVLMAGLAAWGLVFAVDSALHSYLIVAYAESESVAMRVGFYYMANAGGRLVGVALSGALFQAAGQGQRGLLTCLVASGLFVTLAALLCLPLGGAERKSAAIST